MSNSSERICPECGHDAYHAHSCSVFKARIGGGYGPVRVIEADLLPAEAEAQSVDEHLYPHQRCSGCGEEFETTNQRLTHYCKGTVERVDEPELLPCPPVDDCD